MGVREVRHFIFAVLTVFIFVTPAWCDGAESPEEVVITTPVYRPLSDFDQRLGSYEYEVSWQGIPAASLKLNIEREGLRYRVTATARTFSAIDVFYKLRYRAESTLSAVNLMPYRTVIDHRENSRFKNTDIEYLDNGDIRSIRFKRGKGSQTMQFKPNNHMLEPVSAAFLARSLDWDVGDVRYFDTFSGKDRYLIAITATREVEMTVNGLPRTVIVVEPRVQRLNGEAKERKLRQAEIYVTKDKAREILQIKSEVFIGTVTTALVAFTPSSRPRPGTSVAQGKQLIFFE